MARCPTLTWRPVTIKDSYRSAIKAVRVNLHVAVSEAATLHGYFNQSIKNPDSHAYIRKDGSGEQYVDTARQAYADLEGNRDTLSVETQGGVRNVNGEEWTAAQCEALAQFIAWAHKAHGIPLKVATDSRPGPSSHGVSWHRLGIDGNFPGGLLKGRVAGGLKYSNARGKVCPGDAKIRQIPGIVSRAQQIVGGHGVAGITIPPTVQEDDMPLTESEKRELKQYADTAAENVVKKLNEGFARDGQYTAGVWTHANPVSPNTDMRGWLVSTYRKVAEVEAAQVGLVGAIAAIGGGEQFDEAKLLAGVRKAAQAGVAAAIDSIDTTVTIAQEN